MDADDRVQPLHNVEHPAETLASKLFAFDPLLLVVLVHQRQPLDRLRQGLDAFVESHALLWRGRRGDADAAGRHFAGAVHAQFVEHARAGTEVRGKTFGEAGDVEEDISSAIVGTKESETFGFEVSDHAAGLFAGGGFGGGLAAFAGGLGRPAGFVADALLDEGQIGFGPRGAGIRFGWNFKVRIAFPSLFE